MDACHRLDPDCKACGKPVYWKRRIFYLNRLWHLDCFKCSRCNVGLNTDADEENDAQHSKAYLGEDFALRCNRCNELFERKKLDKAAYSRRELIDRFENELIECKAIECKAIECKANRRPPVRQHCEHHMRPDDWSRLNIEDEQELRRLVAVRHECHCVGHRCVKDVRKQGEQRKCSAFGERRRDERRCSEEERRKDERGSAKEERGTTIDERRCTREERRCLKEERRGSANARICMKEDHRRSVVEGPTACRRCSMDKRKSIDRKCSLGERKYLRQNEEHHSRNDRLDGRQANTDSSEIYRSLFRNKSAMQKGDRQAKDRQTRDQQMKDRQTRDQPAKDRQTRDQPAKDRRAQCTCRGCADYMRALKT